MRVVWGFLAGVILTVAGVLGLGVGAAAAPEVPTREREVPVYPYDGCSTDCGWMD